MEHVRMNRKLRYNTNKMHFQSFIIICQTYQKKERTDFQSNNVSDCTLIKKKLINTNERTNEYLILSSHHHDFFQI